MVNWKWLYNTFTCCAFNRRSGINIFILKIVLKYLFALAQLCSVSKQETVWINMREQKKKLSFEHGLIGKNLILLILSGCHSAFIRQFNVSPWHFADHSPRIIYDSVLFTCSHSLIISRFVPVQNAQCSTFECLNFFSLSLIVWICT